MKKANTFQIANFSLAFLIKVSLTKKHVMPNWFMFLEYFPIGYLISLTLIWVDGAGGDNFTHPVGFSLITQK